MIRSATFMLAAALAGSAGSALAQPLPLDRAIAMAREAHPDAQVAAEAEAEMRERETAARAGWYPRVTLQEGWQRGNQPVYVFGSLLNQRRFTEAGFALDALNHPDPLTNHHAMVIARQPVFDPAATTVPRRTARAAAALATVERRAVGADIAVAVAEVYGRVLAAEAALRAATAAVEAGASDLDRAAARRDAGVVTDADVLAVDVHLARMRVDVVNARADARVARAALNRMLGAAADTAWVLSEPADEAALPDAAARVDALRNRTDVAAAQWQVTLAEAAADAARAALLPRVAVEGGVEWNGHRWTDRASSWMAGVRAEFSFSTVLGDAANARAAARHAARVRAQQAGITSAARLDVETAAARLESATARRDIGVAAVMQARESERIIRDRYAAGLATITDLLRATEALLDADALATAGRVDQMVARVALDRALGRLSPAPSVPENRP